MGLRMNKTIFYISFDKGYYIATNIDLNIICYNKTIKRLFENIKEEINILKKEFLECDINDLDDSGILIRNKLIFFK